MFIYTVVNFLDILSNLVIKNFQVTYYNILVRQNDFPVKFHVLSGYSKLHPLICSNNRTEI